MDFSNSKSAAILCVDEMYKADKLAIEGGITGIALMENAGRAVFDVVTANYTPRKTVVLCGPGNNGGDGFVVARLLSAVGWSVSVALSGDFKSLKGDAAHMASLWQGDVEPVVTDCLVGAELVVDGLFGAGLDRPIDGDVSTVIKAIGDIPVIAIDMPSGVNGDTGQVMGIATKASHTVTFFRPKPAHYICPGRQLCGQLTIADIGIVDAVLDDMSLSIYNNSPDLWQDLIPTPKMADHKYNRGYALITGGKEMIGAAKLATRAAQRIGAGMVTVASPEKVAPLYRMAMESVVVKAFRDTAYYNEILSDKRIDACLIGPGLGRDFTAQEKVLATLRTGNKCVLDADALSMFDGHADLLLDSISAGSVLTPHDGEFARIFPDLCQLDKIEKVRLAAKRCNAVVLLKGSDTVIGNPSGQIVINHNAPPYLATAGAGDVLAGLIVGLIAQGCDSFVACAIASWIHGDAANRFGPGLIAEDLITKIPEILSSLAVLELS